MSNRDIKQLLKEVKDSPEFGGEFSDGDVADSWSEVADRIGLEEDVAPRRYSIAEYVDYVLHTFGSTVVKPVAVTMASVLLIFSGWMTTVSASQDSVPGDALYPVKLAAERIQLTIAPQDERTQLRVAFAARRLQEATALRNDDNLANDAEVRQVVAKFQQEMETINSTLAQMQNQNPEQAAQIAMEIDDRTKEYQRILEDTSNSEDTSTEEDKDQTDTSRDEQNETDSEDDSADEMDRARAAVEESSRQATDALLNSYEQTTSQMTRQRLQEKFQDGLADIETRVRLNLGRLEVIESQLEGGTEAGDGQEDEFITRIKDARNNLHGHDEALAEAMDTAAINGYRRAFEILNTVETAIDTSESTIAELEIDISTANEDTQTDVLHPEPEEDTDEQTQESDTSSEEESSSDEESDSTSNEQDTDEDTTNDTTDDTSADEDEEDQTGA